MIQSLEKIYVHYLLQKFLFDLFDLFDYYNLIPLGFFNLSDVDELVIILCCSYDLTFGYFYFMGQVGFNF